MSYDLKPGERLVFVNYSYGLAGSRDSGAGRWAFAASADVAPGAERSAILDAVEAYCRAVPEGQAERVRGYDPNWGDAMDDLASEDWAAFGLRMLPDPVPAARFSVDCDETVYNFDDEEAAVAADGEEADG